MPISQNAVFTGPCESNDDFDHPAGYSLADSLRLFLREDDWNGDSPDNWRDVGWSLNLSKDGAELEIVISEIEHQKWIMQIYPSKVPKLSLFSKILGKKQVELPSATPSDCFNASLQVSKFLQNSNYSDTVWCWDGFAYQENATTAPGKPNER
ncbi:MAG: hypothetical protein AAF431_07600 [Pseudomonadota bacterium]